jgi:hypothetical protein
MLIPPTPVPPSPPAIVSTIAAPTLSEPLKAPQKVTVEQIDGATAAETQKAAPLRANRQVDLTQVPQNRRPLNEQATTGTGDPAVQAKPPSPSLPDEVIRAWYAIQARGVVPNADLMIAELGSDNVTRLFGNSGLPPSVLTALDSLMQSTAPETPR